MRVTFRTDASLQIGNGHVMRCLTLADALKSNGAECAFVSRAHPGHLIEQIRQRGHEVFALPAPAASSSAVQDADYAAWLGVAWQDDADETKRALDGAQPDWLIVDHYSLESAWEQSLRDHCKHLMVIDDLVNRDHDCDVLLDQNLGRQDSDYLAYVPATCKVMTGPRYALLKPDFSALRAESLARRKAPQLKNILVTMGGVDRTDVSSRVLLALKACALPADTRIRVVMGPHAPWLSRVKEIATAMPWPTQVLVGVSNMARIMADSDLAIGAAGSSAWERCCLGLPSLMLVLADNQKDAASEIQKAGAAITLAATESLENDLRSCVSELIENPNAIHLLIEHAQNVTQGNGAALVTAAILEYRQ